ncbi:MAG: hydrogenase maturation protease [Candidatus Obscuribacterales bacterium]|nr:hydrogenase maturation protease [Candidatus Obscuribacterales bacterium]
MQKSMQLNKSNCRKQQQDCAGVAIISIGNVLRQDDGIGFAVLDRLCEEITYPFCRFDLDCYSNHLIDCLKGHNLAIIVDSTLNQGNPGNVTLIDLNAAIKHRQTLRLNSCHTLSLLDELQLAQWQSQLPEKLYFFGVEANNTDWTEGLTPVLQKKLPLITQQLKEALDILSTSNSHA